MKLFQINDNLTYIGTDGLPRSLQVGLDCTDKEVRELWVKYNEGTLKDIDIDILKNPKLKYQIELKRKINRLEKHPDFELIDGSLYKKTINVSIPPLLVEHLADNIDNADKFNALNNFWLFASKLQDANVIEELYKYLDEKGFVITSSGHILAYRNVKVLQGGERQLVEFVSDNVIAVKNNKKSPKNYWVVKNYNGYERITQRAFEDNDYEGDIKGNLQDIYEDIHLFEAVYTYAYTGAGAGKGLKSNEIRLRVPYEMDEKFIDSSSRECSSGLHCCSWDYLENGMALGGIRMAVLVNPMDIRSFPTSYNRGKFRVRRMFPIAVGINQPYEGDLYEDEFIDFTIDKINKELLEKDLGEITKFDLFENNLTPKQFNVISTSYEEIMSKVSNRINSITTHCEKCGTELDSYEAFFGICEQCYDEKE